jgi:hypothetical protein
MINFTLIKITIKKDTQNEVQINRAEKSASKKANKTAYGYRR